VNVEETLASLVDRFNRHAERNPGLSTELEGVSRTITIHLTDGGDYSVDLRGGRLTDLRSGNSRPADLTITCDRETFLGLVRKELGPMKALVTRRLVIDGSLEDKLLFRRLL
jgi:putative sterol carrier protein